MRDVRKKSQEEKVSPLQILTLCIGIVSATFGILFLLIL